MVDDNLIERLWAERTEEPTMSREQIQDALRPRLRRSDRLLKSNLWTYLLMLIATLVLQGLNLAAYGSNPTMLTVQSLVTAAALALMVFGIATMADVGRLDRVDENLADMVDRRLSFFGRKYELWMCTFAVATALLAWSLNTFIDSANGQFRINRPLVFVAVNIAMLLLVYGTLKATHSTTIGELRAVLADLEAQILDRVVAADAARQRWFWGRVLVIVLLTAAALAGLWLFLRGGG